MRIERLRREAVICLVLVASGGAGLAQQSAQSRELLSRRCVSELGEKDVTLFANGTLRVRQRLQEESTLHLVELAPEEMEALESRLAEVDLQEARSVRGGTVGEWVGQCSITLDRAFEGRLFFRYGSFDVLPLGVQRLRDIVSELEQMAAQRAPKRALAASYEPRPGDLLVRHDGSVFEVVGLTADGRGIELAGIDQPVTLYVALEEFRKMFVERAGESLLDIER